MCDLCQEFFPNLFADDIFSILAGVGNRIAIDLTGQHDFHFNIEKGEKQ
jgi:hypothetical protein